MKTKGQPCGKRATTLAVNGIQFTAACADHAGLYVKEGGSTQPIFDNWTATCSFSEMVRDDEAEQPSGNVVQELLELCLNGGTRFKKHVDLRARIQDILNRANTLNCVYCGMTFPPGSPHHGTDVLTRHVERCPRHPVRHLKEENELLRRERAGEVWCWTGDAREDDVESLACPALVPDHIMRRLVHETWSFGLEGLSAEYASDIHICQMVNAIHGGVRPGEAVFQALRALSASCRRLVGLATQNEMRRSPVIAILRDQLGQDGSRLADDPDRALVDAEGRDVEEEPGGPEKQSHATLAAWESDGCPGERFVVNPLEPDPSRYGESGEVHDVDMNTLPPEFGGAEEESGG